MTMQKNVTQQINELHSQLSGHLKKSVSIACEIGQKLTQIKAELNHGEFLPWIESNCEFDRTTATRYIKLFNYKDKCCSVQHLQEAYKKIEQIEYQEKQIEQQKKQTLIDEKVKTGKNPSGWTRSHDYEYDKQKDNEARDERIEALEQKNNIESKNKTKQQSSSVIEEAKEYLKDWENNEREKNNIKNKIKMSINDDSKFIDALNDYLITLETDSLKLEALHNIIKYCKLKVNEYQQKSINYF